MSDPFFEGHKPIRNKICTYEAGTLIDMALRTLYQSENDLTNGRYIPWELLLLIRWTLQYKTQPNPKVPAETDMNGLLTQIRGLSELDKLLPEGGPHFFSKFMRRTAFQQFPYQLKDLHLLQKIGRQLILFEDIGKDFNIPDNFEKLSGFRPQDFLTFCFYLWLAVKNRQFISMADFEVITEVEKVQKLLELISLSVDKAGKYLEQDARTKNKRFVLQLYEISPLFRYPFLKVADKYACYSKRLFHYFFANFIDDFLSKQMDDWGRIFGEIFEEYVEARLQDVSAEYFSDKVWEKRLSGNHKVPDFTLPYPDATVLIEVKSKPLGLQPSVYQTNTSLANNLNDSIVKGVVQIYSLAHALRQKPQDDIKNTDNFYGIVVTYKNHLLGSGVSFWKEFLRGKVEEELKELDIDINIIRPENLFFLSIDEFDYLIMFMKRYPDKPLVNVLEQAKEFAATPATSSYFFEDYLRRMSPENTLAVPDWLLKRTWAFLYTILMMMEEKNPGSMEAARLRREFNAASPRVELEE